MRGGQTAALLVALLAAGCVQSRPVPLEDLLVRPEEMPLGWHLQDVDAQEDDGSIQLPRNPHVFDREALLAMGANETVTARAIAFSNQDDVMAFWSEKRTGRQGMEASLANSCFVSEDVALVSGMNLAFVYSYRLDQLDIARAALKQVQQRTGAANACPKEVARQVADAEVGVWGMETFLPVEQERVTFRYDLPVDAEVDLEGNVFIAALLDDSGGTIADGTSSDEQLASRDRLTLVAGTYILRVDTGPTRFPTSFTFSYEPL